MTARELVFPGDDDGKGMFDVCWLALMLRSDLTTRSARRAHRALKAALRAVSVPLPGATGAAARDMVTLRPEGGTVHLSEEQYVALRDAIAAVPWKGGNVEDVEAAETLLDTAPVVSMQPAPEDARATG